MGLGSAMAGGNPSQARQKDDFYPTPSAVMRALLEYEGFEGVVHEPACGDGALSKVMIDHGLEVVSTDINPRGFGSELDFFDVGEALGDNIVTNPPFNLARRFIEHGLSVLKPRKMALVLKATYWHAATRRDLFERFPPATIYPLLWRPDFLNKGAPTMDVMWCVWDRYHGGATLYRPLPKPTEEI